MTSKPRLLDLFAGAGGSARGYQQAGFHVTGIDIEDQPRYGGDDFVQADIAAWASIDYGFIRGLEIDTFDAIHASPPCQAHTTMSNRWRGKGGRADQHVDLIALTRKLVRAVKLPYVIENVMGAKAHMESPVRICGTSLDLRVQRHRLFETNFPVLVPPCACGAHAPIVGVYGERPDGRRLNSRSVKRIQYAASSLEEGQEAMGIDWMTWDELREAIPPRYTEVLGHQLMQHIKAKAAA